MIFFLRILRNPHLKSKPGFYGGMDIRYPYVDEGNKGPVLICIHEERDYVWINPQLEIFLNDLAIYGNP